MNLLNYLGNMSLAVVLSAARAGFWLFSHQSSVSALLWISGLVIFIEQIEIGGVDSSLQEVMAFLFQGWKYFLLNRY